MLKALISVRFASLIGNIGKDKSGRKRSPVRAILIGLLLLYCLGVFLMMFASSGVMLAPVMIPLGYDWLYFAFFGLIAFSLVFVFSIFETKSQLFECRDNELLMSMPIPYGYILISRIVPLLVFNIAEGFVVLLPALVVYLVFGGSAAALPGVILMGILLPVCASGLSGFVGYLVALAARKLKNNSFVTLIVSFAFVGAYFALMSKVTELMDIIGEDAEGFVSSLGERFSFLGGFGRAFLLSPLPLLSSVAVAGAVAFFSYLFLERTYFKLISISDSVKKKTAYSGSGIRPASPLMAVAKKEFSRFFSSATYMLNSGFGAILKIIAAIALVIKGEMLFELAEILPPPLSGALPIILVLALIVLSSTVTVSSSAISLEGRSFWIIKSAPLRAIDVLRAKLIPHLAISLPSTLILSVCVIIFLKPTAACIPFIIIIPIIADLVFALFGLIINVVFPKFEFSNDAEVVKQSLATLICVLASFAFAILVYSIGLSIYMLLGLFFTLVLLFVLFSALLVVLCLVLQGPISKRLDKIGV